MVIPIDAVRYDAGLDGFGRWHRATEYRSSEGEEAERDMMAPVRGAVYGLLLSGVLWVGLVAAARGLLTLAR